MSTALFAGQTTPRETFKTYLKAMVGVKSNTLVEDNYVKAISTLDLEHLSPSQQQKLGRAYALSLVKTIDKIKKVDYLKIPAEYDHHTWYFDKRMYQDELLEISLTKKDDKWFFSQETVNSLDKYKKALKSTSNVGGVAGIQNFSDMIRAKIPTSLQSDFILLETWQWLTLALFILFAFILEWLVLKALNFALQKSLHIIEDEYKKHLTNLTRPIGKIVFLNATYFLINYLDFPIHLVDKIQRGIEIIISIVIVWAMHRFINIVSYYFLKKAAETETKFDDIFIPLLTKTAFIIAYAFGAVFIAKALTVDVTSILAGLGIGGLAFAFAAKDTLANFFGSIMLILDRPFDIGDVITAGSIEGTVVEVGFRSTRVRTFYDSLITVSNGQLMNMSIDNKGKRRYRRLNTTLGVEYDTPPEKIEAFCEGIRQIIVEHKWTRKDSFHVYFTNFGASALEIQLMVYWETADYAREQAEKHRLMIDILRLAKEMEICFAFPTQTVHLFNEQKAQKRNVDQKYLDEGINKAKQVVQKPVSLKNPRSNKLDKEQFGNNDIGL